MNMTCLPDDVLDAALTAAAETLIECLQAIPDLQGAKVCIIGGMAVRKYMPDYRRTFVSAQKPGPAWSPLMLTGACILVQDVDVLLFRPDRPIDNHLIRKELVSQFSDLFEEGAEPLFFKYDHPDQFKKKSTSLVQVDIIPEYLPPCLPAQAMTLEDVDKSHLPFVDPLDLLAYKVHCSSMRSCHKKRKQDAEDAMRLWRTRYGQDGIFQALSLEKVEAKAVGKLVREEHRGGGFNI
ncbi:hypothetical protein CNMCM5793_000856 [Aspergillus hiratsukae]|uniref:Uncharacterized protein n=1 Tax=Aspergillus hiratsukae TaxID=1194566 RepID=A0A8H6PZ78_9EURO|nr:hypothetical protein CNMCM5793_000856 [Aspergillus hiratsukae]KAF7163098.1 hypothetical protein CNMCM6106_000130 [Aspergillus hiratsukae]